MSRSPLGRQQILERRCSLKREVGRPRSLPLRLADPDWRGMSGRDGSRAVPAGLVRRPLEQTHADTLLWELSRPGHVRGAGLTDDDERALLAELRD